MLLQLRAREHGHVRSERSTELNDVSAPLEFMQKTTTAEEFKTSLSVVGRVAGGM
jgi:hypothetical protein